VLAFAVAPGPHGRGVTVHPGAGVEVVGRSREHVIRLAAFFFATVALNDGSVCSAAILTTALGQ
jgi:hypothetical protein